MKHILIIGGGQLGSRHLQAVKKCEFPVSIVVLDPSRESLTVCESRYKEIEDNANVESIQFLTELN